MTQSIRRSHSPPRPRHRSSPPLPHCIENGNNGDWIGGFPYRPRRRLYRFPLPQTLSCPKSAHPRRDLRSELCRSTHTRREEEVEEGMEIFRASNGAARRFDSRMLTALAEIGETMRRKAAIVRPPPIELVDYPDIFERAWGWDSLLPGNLVTPLPLYKIYLRKYYIRNHQREAADDLNGDDHGNGLLATLADSCIKMEDHLMFTWNHRGKSFTINSDEEEVPLLSENITKRAREMSQVPVSEFPAAAIALKCITKGAELMCQCIISGSFAVSFNVSNGIRQCALSFMTYKDYVPAAAVMMGIMKEAELVIKLLRGVQMKNKGNLGYTDIVRHRTMLMMLEMCDECSAVAEPTVAEITGDLKFNESEDKLAENGNHEDRGNVNENKNSKEELTRNDANERNMQDENKNGNEKLERNSLDVDKVKPDTKNPNEKLGRNSLEVDKVKPDTKVESSQVQDENKNPNVLGRNSLEVDKAGTEKPPNLVGSSKEGHNSTSKQRIKDVLKHQSSGKAGGHRKWISGCFHFETRSANGTAS